MLAQPEALNLAGKVFGGIETLVKRFGVKSTQIGTRFFESIEVGPSEATMLERGEFFSKRGRQIFSEFYKSQDIPEHIIHVTCTGYVAPSPAQWLVNERQWHGQTDITHAYHMGCYASMPTIRLARGLLATGVSKVDIVHTEMCSLHFDKKNQTPEQIVVQSLFADGHIKYEASQESKGHGLSVKTILEELVPDSLNDLTWTPGPSVMQMTLSRDVPQKIGQNLKPFIERLVKKSGLNWNEILKTGLFAIHPGGPKIIDTVQSFLELSDDQVSHSRKVLFLRGNMSSSTLPHIWKNIIEDDANRGRIVISLAFGPGLTLFGSVSEVI